MPKFSYPKKQLLQLLSKDEIERIHFSSMKILEENGVMVKNDRALNLLKESGCEVNLEKKVGVHATAPCEGMHNQGAIDRKAL